MKYIKTKDIAEKGLPLAEAVDNKSSRVKQIYEKANLINTKQSEEEHQKLEKSTTDYGATDSVSDIAINSVYAVPHVADKAHGYIKNNSSKNSLNTEKIDIDAPVTINKEEIISSLQTRKKRIKTVKNNCVKDTIIRYNTAEKPTATNSNAMRIKEKRLVQKGKSPRQTKTALSTSVTNIKSRTKLLNTKAVNAKKAKNDLIKLQKMSEMAIKTAKITAKLTVKSTKLIVKGIITASKSLIALLSAGGVISVVISVVILMVGMLLGSGFGIFFSNDLNGIKMSDIVSELSTEYYTYVAEIEQSIEHDYVEYIANDGRTSIAWVDVLAVYAARRSMSPERGNEVVTLNDDKKNIINSILWEMNEVSHRTYISEREIVVEVEVEKEDENGEIYIAIETRLEIIQEINLVIEITHISPEEMANRYSFNKAQNEQLELLLNEEQSQLWVRLLGDIDSGIGYAPGGEILAPGADGNGTLAWPLPIQGNITSPFGYRKDPFTGVWTFHRGTDIAAPHGTPILAAADGTVTVANSTDSWGFSWGYYVKIQHAGNTTTLYAHCSAISVRVGQKVKQGEVIGYVGSTGASTGNHLHIEVEVGGNLQSFI